MCWPRTPLHGAASRSPCCPSQTQAAMSRLVSGTVGVANPVDLGAGASTRSLDDCVDVLLSSGEVDAVLIVTARTGVSGSATLMDGVAEVRARHPETPVLLVALGFDDPAVAEGLTVFDDAESATEALSQAARYAKWRRTPSGGRAHRSTSSGRGRRAARPRPPSQGRPPHPAGCRRPTRSGCWPTTASRGRSASWSAPSSEALAAAEEFGYPVVAKVADPSVIHKTERRLVHTGLGDAQALTAAVEAIHAEMGRTVRRPAPAPDRRRRGDRARHGARLPLRSAGDGRRRRRRDGGVAGPPVPPATGHRAGRAPGAPGTAHPSAAGRATADPTPSTSTRSSPS